MLVSEEYSIKEIAMLAGYPNALNFSTEFRRMTGCSPTQFRMQKNHDAVMRKLETQPELPRPHRDMVIWKKFYSQYGWLAKAVRLTFIQAPFKNLKGIYLIVKQ